LYLTKSLDSSAKSFFLYTIGLRFFFNLGPEMSDNGTR